MEIKEITHPVMRAQKKRLDGLEQIITNNLEYLVQLIGGTNRNCEKKRNLPKNLPLNRPNLELFLKTHLDN